MQYNAGTIQLSGSNYDIGYKLGERTAQTPEALKRYTGGFLGFGVQQLEESLAAFRRWCPGLEEELQGFCDAMRISPLQMVYHAMTWLRPNCSQIALLPGFTENGQPLLVRSYEFHPMLEDFTLAHTQATGRYAHLGTTVACFGRDEGVNEHGLAVAMSSTGMPVGAGPQMRPPALAGFQFWAVIRTLLEGCKTVEEALALSAELPIAFNLNMILLDASGQCALLETIDGRKAVKRIQPGDGTNFLHATNHPVLPELIPYEPQAMEHSLVRYQFIQETLTNQKSFSVERAKKLLLDEYPHGLNCHFYEDFFGTTKSILLSPADKTLEICWGGSTDYGWQRHKVTELLPESAQTITLEEKRASPEFFHFKPIVSQTKDV